MLRKLTMMATAVGLAVLGATAGTQVAAVANTVASTLPAQPAAAVPAGSVRPADVDILFLTNRDRRLEEFWRGSDCALWHAWQLSPGGSWSGNASLGGCLTSGVDGESNADGRLEVFARGTDNAIYHIWQQSSGGWSGWASLGGLLVTGPFTGVTGDQRIWIDALGPDGIWHRRIQNSPNCCWSGWIFGVAH